MAKISIYGYRPGKLPIDYRPIHPTADGMTATELPTLSNATDTMHDDRNFICNVTNFLFATNKSHKLRFSHLYVKFVCLMVVGWTLAAYRLF